MNGEKLFAAMSHIDERFVQEAEITCIASQRIWIRLGAMAACFALLAGIAGFAIRYKDGRETVIDNEAMTESTASVVMTEQSATVAGVDDLTDGANSMLVPGEIPSVLVSIDAWLENGFMATVVELVDTDIFPAGSTLQVEFAENVCIAMRSGDTVNYAKRQPTQLDYPTGSVVWVMFSDREDHRILVVQIGMKEDML